jgi:drug/metabolite transporter (DMT)-like permease
MFKNLSKQDAANWASAILVVIVSGLAGQLAAHGMNAVQWLGAALAVLGSITLAVMVRVWPQAATVKRD